MRWGRRVKTLPRLLATNHLLHQEVSRLTKQSCSTLEDVENYHNRSSAETRGQAIRAVFSALILKLVAAGIAKKARDGLWHLGQLIDKLYLLNQPAHPGVHYPRCRERPESRGSGGSRGR